jgi:hypothetical protein
VPRERSLSHRALKGHAAAATIREKAGGFNPRGSPMWPRPAAEAGVDGIRQKSSGPIDGAGWRADWIGPPPTKAQGRAR